MPKARPEKLQGEGSKIGWNWPMVRVGKRLYARNPSGQLVRVTDADINREVVSFVRKFGFSK